jgi:RNA polymerase sigma factor (sigma-70 family)
VGVTVGGEARSQPETQLHDAGEFPRLVARLRAGDSDAAEALYRLCGPYLRAAVRRQLHVRLRTRYDSLDFVQDVWASFLALPPGQHKFDTPAALIGFLQRVAYHKVVEGFRRRFESQRDDARREVAIDGGPDGRSEDLPSPTGTPSQWAIAGEEFDRLVSRLPPGYQVIVHRLRDGYTLTDIARMANVSRSTVDRVVRRLKDLTGV